MFPRVTDVVKHLLIINVIFFVVFHILFTGYKDAMALYYPGLEQHFKPYQIVTHMFMHGNEQHILFNMISLFFFGPMVEQRMGPKRFLTFYLICGFGAVALHMGLIYTGYLSQGYRVVGASGAIMGIFVAFALFFPNREIHLIIPPIPIKAKYMILGLIAIDLFSGVSGQATGIAHFAHLGGALAGAILINIWDKYPAV